MKKKILTATLAVLSAVVLVVATVFTTIAWLSDSQTVVNSFTVGDVAIELYESRVDSETGEVVDPQEKVLSNSYHLKPGKTYTKDPTIEITSSHASDTMYLFVKSSNGIRQYEAGNAEGATSETPKTMRQQMLENGWVEFIKSGDGVDIVWVYGIRQQEDGVIVPTPVNCNSVQVGKDDQNPANKGIFDLCKEFTVAGNAQFGSNKPAAVTFTAFAIQDTGFEGNTKKAWDEIKNTYANESTILSPVNPYDPNNEDPYAAVDPTP